MVWEFGSKKSVALTRRISSSKEKTRAPAEFGSEDPRPSAKPRVGGQGLKNYSSESQLLHNVVIAMQRQCTRRKVTPEGAAATDPILG